MNQTFYFTYARDGQMPFRNGWTEVVAPDRATAIAIFRIVHPDRTPDTVNCASIYTEAEFQATPMAKYGNYGARCVETLALDRRFVNADVPSLETWIPDPTGKPVYRNFPFPESLDGLDIETVRHTLDYLDFIAEMSDDYAITQEEQARIRAYRQKHHL